MKTPRDLSGADLAKSLKKLGYAPMRQRGSHLTLTTQRDGEFHVAIPLHGYIKIGTLNNILNEIAEHHQLSKQQVLELLDL